MEMGIDWAELIGERRRSGEGGKQKRFIFMYTYTLNIALSIYVRMYVQQTQDNTHAHIQYPPLIFLHNVISIVPYGAQRSAIKNEIDGTQTKIYNYNIICNNNNEYKKKIL